VTHSDDAARDRPGGAPLSALRVEHERVGSAVVVHVAGELEMTTAATLRAELVRARELVVPPAPLVLDLSGLSFLASMGLRVLVDQHAYCAQHGMPLRLVADQRVVLRPLEITELTSVFTIATTVADALADQSPS
jgi:anti-sigma B factor antagonist